MKRRQSFFKIAVGFLGSIGVFAVSTCKLMADHFSKYSWPSYPNEASLRKHLLGKPHYLSRSEIAKLSFEQLRKLHDDDHTKTGGKPPPESRLWMNKVYKKPVKKTPASQRSTQPAIQETPKHPPAKKVRKYLPDERYGL